jgi:predicted nucleic acid-binding protein
VYLLDTDILIDIQLGYRPAVVWFNGLEVLPHVSGLVVMEMIQDAANSQQLQSVLKLVSPLPTLWPTVSDCQRALAEFTRFHLSHGIGLLDALIGATAIGAGAQLCTFNIKHYRVFADLQALEPYSKP